MRVAKVCPSESEPVFLSGVVDEDLGHSSPRLSSGNFQSESNRMNLRSPGLVKNSRRTGGGKWGQLDDDNKIGFTRPGTVIKTPYLL